MGTKSKNENYVSSEDSFNDDGQRKHYILLKAMSRSVGAFDLEVRSKTEISDNHEGVLRVRDGAGEDDSFPTVYNVKCKWTSPD